jgi:2',3'-cyclic-nucleotide 2'-phosphodiesterase (5'-nucleotidase family)
VSSTIVKRERDSAARSLWLDSGDCFQGAPVFNMFKGEAEMRFLSLAGLDAAVIGNHEFDRGSKNLVYQIDNWAQFPGTPKEVSGTDVWVIRGGKVLSQTVLVNSPPAAK